MEAQSRHTAPRSRPARSMELVLVRANAPLFFSVAAAALLEAAAADHAERISRAFLHDAEFCDWLTNHWAPAKRTRSGILRGYVEANWPEFDWSAAREHHRALVGAAGAPMPYSPDAPRFALAGCVAAAQCALAYRALARWGDDRRLRALAHALTHEEAQSFARFRGAFERAARSHRVGFAAAWRTALACVRTARDAHVRLAFEALAAQWTGQAPFPTIDYREFVARMRAVVLRCAGPTLAERIVFWAWQRPLRTGVQATPSAAPTWFKPVLAPAT